MAIDNSSLKNNVITSLVLAGKDKAIVLGVVDDLILSAKKTLWRLNNWTFARKSTTLTLPASDTDGINAPADADAVITLTRLTTSDDGYLLRPLPEATFDLFFPNLAEVTVDDPAFVKIVVDNGVMKLYCSPPAKAETTLGCVYKMKFDAAVFDKVTPVDYELLLLTNAIYLAMPAGSQERPSVFYEWQELLKQMKRKDRANYVSANQFAFGDVDLISRNSWRFYLDGEDYHGMS